MQLDLYIVLALVSFLFFIIATILYISERSKNRNLYIKYEQLHSELQELQELKNELQLKYAILNTRYEEEINSSSEKIEALQDAKEELSVEFKLLANKIFEEKSKMQTHANREHLELLLQPFREQIVNFSKQSREQFHLESKDRHLLRDELFRLKEMNLQLSNDANNLASALKGENKTQGGWGEIVLEKILEDSGLREGLEYETQLSLNSKEGKNYRPDVVVHMPQNRDIVIDSKVSLVAYERFMSSENESDKKEALKAHMLSISTHIKELSAKRYEKLEGINTLDYVLLFMPIEGSFLIALGEDGEFFKLAYEKNILVVSPSTLMVTLKTIEHIWRTQRQEENAQKIVDEAEAMYDKFVAFVDEMKSVGFHIQKTTDAYDTAMKRLNTGRGNLIKRAQNMKSLGIKPKKKLLIKSEEEE